MTTTPDGPPTGAAMTSRVDQLRSTVLDQIGDELQGRRRRKRKHVASFLGVSAAVLVGGSVAAAAIITWGSNPGETVYCFPIASLSETRDGEAGTSQIAGTAATYEDPVSGDVKDNPWYMVTPMDPIDTCTYLWEEGIVNRTGADVGEPQVAPPLGACLLPNGGEAAFPKARPNQTDSDLCASLNLPEYEEHFG